MTSTGTSFIIENSYNAASGRTNTVVSNSTYGLTGTSGSYSGNILGCGLTRSNTNSDPKVFDLTNDYYIMFARGTVTGGNKDKHSVTDRTSLKVDLQSTIDIVGGGVEKIEPFKSIMIMLSLSRIIMKQFPTHKMNGMTCQKLWTSLIT
ncbi:uncharacterized protein LOC127729414 isoform X2 [Mytilus californianus]|uniref:uncharacterized protein LOC127729414 isoform X2 n=1 Tax=Mytilus californianus TaxID=6549 RepID=UPI0022450ADD|nr:uncharacterized protein LOC127729414 isoform X2 [Mytilus californianus]